MVQQLDSVSLVAWWKHQPNVRLIEIYASWCIYHYLTSKKVIALAAEFTGQVDVGRFDIVGHEELVKSLGITAVPGIVLLAGEHRKVWYGDTDLDLIQSSVLQAIDQESGHVA